MNKQRSFSWGGSGRSPGGEKRKKGKKPKNKATTNLLEYKIPYQPLKPQNVLSVCPDSAGFRGLPKEKKWCFRYRHLSEFITHPQPKKVIVSTCREGDHLKEMLRFKDPKGLANVALSFRQLLVPRQGFD